MSERPDSNTRVCNLWTPAIAKTPAYLAESSHLLLLAMLVFAQGFLHFPEHAAQALQRFYVGSPASGIIGQLNVEWVHAIYNWGLLIAMIPLMVGCGFLTRNSAWKRYNRVAWFALVASFWIQVWHAFEHYGKLAQYYRNLTAVPAVVPPDGPNAPGLLGYFIHASWGPSGLVVLHFTVNLIVFIPMIYAFFAFDFPGAIRNRLRGEPSVAVRAAE
jgi:hypothetical protein